MAHTPSTLYRVLLGSVLAEHVRIALGQHGYQLAIGCDLQADAKTLYLTFTCHPLITDPTYVLEMPYQQPLALLNRQPAFVLAVPSVIARAMAQAIKDGPGKGEQRAAPLVGG